MQIHCTCHTKYRKSIKQLRHSHFLGPAEESIGWGTPSRMQMNCTCHTKSWKSIKQLRHSHFLNPAVESIGWQTPSRMQMYCTCHTKYKKSMESLYHSHLSRRAANSSWERQAAPHHDSQWFLIRIYKFNTNPKESR